MEGEDKLFKKSSKKVLNKKKGVEEDEYNQIVVPNFKGNPKNDGPAKMKDDNLTGVYREENLKDVDEQGSKAKTTRNDGESKKKKRNRGGNK
jgi:hypothetical protein